jgi:hypothetical protein
MTKKKFFFQGFSLNLFRISFLKEKKMDSNNNDNSLRICSYEISASRRCKFSFGVLRTKGKVITLDLNFHWPSLVRFRILVDAAFFEAWQRCGTGPFWRSDTLHSECLANFFDGYAICVVLKLDKPTEVKLRPYSLHHLEIGGRSLPIRISAKRSTAPKKRRVDNDEDTVATKVCRITAESQPQPAENHTQPTPVSSTTSSPVEAFGENLPSSEGDTYFDFESLLSPSFQIDTPFEDFYGLHDPSTSLME